MRNLYKSSFQAGQNPSSTYILNLNPQPRQFAQIEKQRKGTLTLAMIASLSQTVAIRENKNVLKRTSFLAKKVIYFDSFSQWRNEDFVLTKHNVITYFPVQSRIYDMSAYKPINSSKSSNES